MYERDWLVRLIQQSAKALGTIMGLKEQNKPEEAIEQIDEFLGRELRLRSRMAMGLSDEALLNMLSIGGEPNAEQVAIVAAFLQEEAELLAALGRHGESVPRFAKSLRLQLHVLRENGGIDGWDVRERVDRLLASLSPYRLDAETLHALWRWREAEGQYADAENLLYELKDAGGIGMAEGYDFYDRLALQSDSTLEAGLLPREELEEGKRQWSLLEKESIG